MAKSRRPGDLVQLRHPDPKKKMPRMPKDSYAIGHRTARVNIKPPQRIVRVIDLD